MERNYRMKNKKIKELVHKSNHDDLLSIDNIFYDIRFLLAVLIFIGKCQMLKNVYKNINLVTVFKIFTYLFLFFMPIAASLAVIGIQNYYLRIFWVLMDSISSLYFMQIIIFLNSRVKKIIINFLISVSICFLIFIPFYTFLDILYIEKVKIEFFGLFLDLFGITYFFGILLLLFKRLKLIK